MSRKNGKTFTVDKCVEMDWDAIYEELNAEGRLLVDYFAVQFERSVKNGIRRSYGVGEKAAREVALSMLCHFWDGRLPEDFPALVRCEVRSAVCEVENFDCAEGRSAQDVEVEA